MCSLGDAIGDLVAVKRDMETRHVDVVCKQYVIVPINIFLQTSQSLPNSCISEMITQRVVSLSQMMNHFIWISLLSLLMKS